MEPLRLRWDRDEIAERVTELGEEIGTRYRGTVPILVTVLNGGAVFLADLVRAIPLTLQVEFLAVRPLDPRAGPGGQPVALAKDIEVDLSGRHVLLVEDIVASGLTLSYLLRVLAARDPASLRGCTLLDRPGSRIPTLPLDHVGFRVGPELLVGYGLDLDGWFRNCPDLWEVADARSVRADPADALAWAGRQRRHVAAD